MEGRVSEAIKLRYEKLRPKKRALTSKHLQKHRPKSLKKFDKDWEVLKCQLDSLVKLGLMNETDYRNSAK
jgi:hypothetical protein